MKITFMYKMINSINFILPKQSVEKYMTKLHRFINDKLISALTLCTLGNFSCFFCRLLIFFYNQLSRKILSEIPSECQRVWIQIRPGVLLGLIGVQTVCKNYQQTTLGGKESALNRETLSRYFCSVCPD